MIHQLVKSFYMCRSSAYLETAETSTSAIRLKIHTPMIPVFFVDGMVYPPNGVYTYLRITGRKTFTLPSSGIRFPSLP